MHRGGVAGAAEVGDAAADGRDGGGLRGRGARVGRCGRAERCFVADRTQQRRREGRPVVGAKQLKDACTMRGPL